MSNALVVISQEKNPSVWKKEKDLLKYKKADKYKGPEDWYGAYPASMKDEDYSNNPSSLPNINPGIQYSPQQIQKDREKRYSGFDRGGGDGDLPFDPKVERPDPIELPDIDTPDVDVPDLNIDPPSIPPGVWKFLLFLIIFTAVLVIVYILIKNKKPTNVKVIIDVENEWNPTVVSKTELELKLEEALSKENYRECVRIYFTFILKELVKKSWITWKKEKTNYHYVLEMHKRPNAQVFNECVRIYDVVWYGDYTIDADVFELLKPTLEEYYKSLEPTNE